MSQPHVQRASLSNFAKCLCSQTDMLYGAEWNELPYKTQPFETVAEKYSSNDVSTILLTCKKHPQWSQR